MVAITKPQHNFVADSTLEWASEFEPFDSDVEFALEGETAAEEPASSPDIAYMPQTDADLLQFYFRDIRPISEPIDPEREQALALAVERLRVDVPEVPGTAPVYPISRTQARFNDPHTLNRFTSACSAMVYREELFGQAFIGNSLAGVRGLSHDHGAWVHGCVGKPAHQGMPRARVGSVAPA